jgi:hypothetical protein
MKISTVYPALDEKLARHHLNKHGLPRLLLAKQPT